MPAHSRFWGSRGRSPPRFLTIEHLFGNACGFVLGDYLRGLFGLRGFGLLVLSLRASMGFWWLLRGISWGLLDLLWVVGFRPLGLGRACLLLVPIHETILLVDERTSPH
jgi:hypothetical protein